MDRALTISLTDKLRGHALHMAQIPRVEVMYEIKATALDYTAMIHDCNVWLHSKHNHKITPTAQALLKKFISKISLIPKL